MARKSYTSVVIVLVVFVVLAVIFRFYGGSLMESLKSLHGGGGGH
jgi:hypothetical protein